MQIQIEIHTVYTAPLNISITELYFWSTWSFASSGLVHLLLISRDCGSVQYRFLPLFKYIRYAGSSDRSFSTESIPILVQQTTIIIYSRAYLSF